MHLAAALANTRTPEAREAQLASGRDDAILAGHSPEVIDAALADFRVLLEAQHRADPNGRNAMSSTPAARERRRDGAIAAREEVERHLSTEESTDLLGDTLDGDAPPLDEHEARKAKLRANRASYTALAGERS